MSNEEKNTEPENHNIDTSLNLPDDELPDVASQEVPSEANLREAAEEPDENNFSFGDENAKEIQPDISFDSELSDYESPEKMVTVRPVKFQELEMTEPNRSIKRNLDIMQDVSMHISVELGKAISTIKEVMDLTTGSIVELDKIAGEQVEIYANNKLIARGEVIVIEDKFGVRVTSTNIPKTIQ